MASCLYQLYQQPLSPSALLGICGACLEKVRLVLVFAILYLLNTIASIVYIVVDYSTWEYDGDVSVGADGDDGDVTEAVSNDNKEEKVKVSKGAILLTSVGITVAILLLQVYFAVCLFSFYFQLKKEKEEQKRDAELAFVGKNTS